MNDTTQLLQIFENHASEGRRVLTRSEMLQSNSALSSLAQNILAHPDWSPKVRQAALGRSDLRGLSSRLKRSILDSLFVLDLSRKHYSQYMQRTYRCEKDAFTAKILVKFGARSIALKVAGKALREAKRLELTSTEIELLRLLRQHSQYLGDQVLHRRYNDEIMLAMDRYSAEIRASFLFEKNTIKFTRSAGDLTVDRYDSKSLSEVERLFKKHGTFKISIIYYRMKTSALQTQSKYSEAADICHEALTFVSQSETFGSTQRMLEFHTQVLASAAGAGNPELAKCDIAESQRLVRQDSNNWFHVSEYCFLLFMQSKEFERGKALAVQALEHPRFPNMPDYIKTKWQLFKQYADYSTGVASTNLHSRLKQRRSSSANLFESLPQFENDKAGYRSASIILQILMLFELKRFDLIFDRIDALRVFTSRYLKHQEQTKMFIELLILAHKHSEEPGMLQTRIPKLLQAIEDEHTKKGYLEGIQIIPYPLLGAMLLRRLVRSKVDVVLGETRVNQALLTHRNSIKLNKSA